MPRPYQYETNTYEQHTTIISSKHNTLVKSCYRCDFSVTVLLVPVVGRERALARVAWGRGVRELNHELRQEVRGLVVGLGVREVARLVGVAKEILSLPPLPAPP